MRTLLLLFVICFGCKANQAATTQTPRLVTIGGSVTETVVSLGFGSQIVGVDTSSTFPESVTKLPQVGYMRRLSAEGILALQPTLIIASKEAGPPAVIEQLKSAGISIKFISAEDSIEGAAEKIKQIAEAVGEPSGGANLIDSLKKETDVIRAAAKAVTQKPRVLFIYARGQGALFVGGSKTGAATMIREAGGENAIADFNEFTALTPEAVVSAAPDIILIPQRGLESIGGLEGLFKLPGVELTPAAQNKQIITIDDQLLLGFGPRTAEGLRLLFHRLHPMAPFPARQPSPL